MNDKLKMQPEEKVCGTCRSIVQGAIDPQNITTRRYECRRFPPQMVLVGPGQVNVMYPVINPQMPGCNEHKGLLAVNI
jgi:hypothetical protein